MAKLRNFLLGTLAAAGLVLGGYGTYYHLRSAVEAREEEKVPQVDISKYSLAGLMNIIKEAQHSEHMILASKEALKIMQEHKYTALAFSSQGKLYTLPDSLEQEDFDEVTSGSVIAHKDSGLVRFLRGYLGKNTGPLVENNVEWVVFSPHVIRGTVEMGGLSIGEKIVYLDTEEKQEKQEKQEKTSLIYLLTTLVHEAQHEATPQETPTLLNEQDAFKKGKELAEWFLKRTVSKNKKYKLPLSEEEKQFLQYNVTSWSERITRAEYLAQFDDDFLEVYPPKTILAGDLLEARISKRVLEKYERFTLRNNLDDELVLAVKTALLAYRLNVNKAALQYQQMLQGDEPEQKNARSAIDYLFPKEKKTFWKDLEKDIKDIKDFFVEDGPQQLYADLPEQKVQGYVPQKKREAQQREELKIIEARILPDNYEHTERKLNERFSKLEGDPDKEKGEWTYKGWQYDENGTTMVLYQSHTHGFSLQGKNQQSENQYLTKQDSYEQGKFVGTFWNFLPAYQDKTTLPEVWNGSVWVQMEEFKIYPSAPAEEKGWTVTEPMDVKEWIIVQPLEKK